MQQIGDFLSPKLFNNFHYFFYAQTAGWQPTLNMDGQTSKWKSRKVAEERERERPRRCCFSYYIHRIILGQESAKHRRTDRKTDVNRYIEYAN